MRYIRPVWQNKIELDKKLGIILILLFTISRFTLVLSANATGNYQYVSLLFVAMILTPFILLTDKGKVAIGYHRPKSHLWVFYSFLIGIVASSAVYFIGYLFFRDTGFHTGYIGSSNFSRSALTDGLEWNIKITTKEVSHIIDKFQKTFDSYWQSEDFELFDDNKHKEKLISSLNQGKNSKVSEINLNFFEKGILKRILVESANLENSRIEVITSNN